jgi:hypothetical protein
MNTPLLSDVEKGLWDDPEEDDSEEDEESKEQTTVLMCISTLFFISAFQYVSALRTEQTGLWMKESTIRVFCEMRFYLATLWLYYATHTFSFKDQFYLSCVGLGTAVMSALYAWAMVDVGFHVLMYMQWTRPGALPWSFLPQPLYYMLHGAVWTSVVLYTCMFGCTWRDSAPSSLHLRTVMRMYVCIHLLAALLTLLFM